MIHTSIAPETIVAARREWLDAAWLALDHCDPDDRFELLTAWMAKYETGGPPLGDPFGMVAGDARLWAAAAPPHELVAFTLAGLERLPDRHLSLTARKQVFKALWRSLPETDRASFIAHVKGGK
ncbi:MAG: hypothetical protein JJT81_11830 [Rubellimicrobium sp.]|nr:hypothetical protein [Rubellimicrobium sp.]